MKKIIALLTLILMLFSFVSCGKGSTNNVSSYEPIKLESEPTELGESEMSAKLPEGFKEIEETASNEAYAYYRSEDSDMLINMYSWDTDPEMPVDEQARRYAEEFGATAKYVTINGIKGMFYEYKTDEEGKSGRVLNYMLDDGEYVVLFTFYTDNSTKQRKDVEEIINSVTSGSLEDVVE